MKTKTKSTQYYLLRGEFKSSSSQDGKPSKEEIYLLAAQIQDACEDCISFKRAIYSAMLSYDYYCDHEYLYNYDHEYLYNYDYDYDNNHDYDYYYDYYYDYDYYYYHDYYHEYSKQERVMALLFLSAMNSTQQR